MTTQTTSNRLLSLNDSLPASIKKHFVFDKKAFEFTVSKNRHTASNRDTENGLYYFNHRFYDPNTKRFLSKDPAAIDVNDPRTINRYTFVNNNPLRYYDPNGMFSWEGFTSSIKQGWGDNGLSGAISGGFGNLGENFSNLSDGKGFSDNLQLDRVLNFEAEFAPSPGRGSYVEGNLSINDGYGTTIDSWKANSGGYGNGAIPRGKFSMGKIDPVRTKPGMVKDGRGWSVDINNVSEGRFDMRIHPDQFPRGTYGCIGIMENLARHLELLNSLQANKFTKINVTY